MPLFFWILALIVIVVILVSLIEIKHSYVYLVLWSFSAINLLFYSELRVWLSNLFSIDNFGQLGTSGLGWFFFVFAITTVIHQGYIYYYLHDMETEPVKWERLYPKFYNSVFDRSTRILAFFFLLMGIGKISVVSHQFYSNYSADTYSESLFVFLIGSCVLFLILFIYDCVAGTWCDKWKETKHWIHTLGDLFALLFWGTIVFRIIIMRETTMGAITIIPIVIGFLYILFFTYRVVNSIRNKEVQ